ncbi:MAG: hypothetical protein AAFO93_15130 [Pseudomonadota bacterium]
MDEDKKPKFGPTRGEYIFRMVSGAVILALIAYATFAKGMPTGITSTESILFGLLFALFLVGHSGWRLWTGKHR